MVVRVKDRCEGGREVGVVVKGHVKDPCGIGAVHRGGGYTHAGVPVKLGESEDGGMVSFSTSDSWNGAPSFPRTPMDDQHQTPLRPRPLPTLQDCLPPGLLLDSANSSYLLGLLNPTLHVGVY